MNFDQINQFWQETFEELASVPMEAEVAEADPGGMMHDLVKTSQNYSVRMSSFEGVKIRGWFTVPIGAPPPGGFPTLITDPGYFGVQSLA